MAILVMGKYITFGWPVKLRLTSCKVETAATLLTNLFHRRNSHTCKDNEVKLVFFANCSQNKSSSSSLHCVPVYTFGQSRSQVLQTIALYFHKKIFQVGIRQSFSNS